VEDVIFVDAKRGQGIRSIHRAIIRAGVHVNERRARRGLSDRALRVGIIGYPNVGKSALINRILNRRRAKTADKPGVTRSLQWIRVKSEGSNQDGKNKINKNFELLDSPGIIPVNLIDQSDALLVAACNSIGQASYDNQKVAAHLLQYIQALHFMDKGIVTSPQWPKKFQDRFYFDPLAIHSFEGEEPRIPTGEDMLFMIADNTCQGNPEDAARKILMDFRMGRMGLISLQLAPESDSDNGQIPVRIRSQFDDPLGSEEEQRNMLAEMRGKRAEAAVKVAKQKGLELPPMVLQDPMEEPRDDESGNEKVAAQDVGKGMFDGW